MNAPDGLYTDTVVDLFLLWSKEGDGPKFKRQGSDVEYEYKSMKLTGRLPLVREAVIITANPRGYPLSASHQLLWSDLPEDVFEGLWDLLTKEVAKK